MLKKIVTREIHDNLKRLLVGRFNNYNTKYTLDIDNIHYIHNEKLCSRWKKYSQEYGSFLCFHKIRSNDSSVLESISVNGLQQRYCSRIFNKGYGVYLASHSNYPLLWGDGHIILCDVAKHPNYLKSFRSEIPPGQEYVVTNDEIVLPLLAFKSNVTFLERLKTNNFYYKYGDSGCDKCDKKKIRCDCTVLLESYEQNMDFIYIFS